MSPLIKKALYFAAEKHDGQYRKGGRVPYIVHPVHLAFDIQKYTKDEKIIAAAILHDVLEDCPSVSLAILQKEFGKYIAQIVDEVSLYEPKKYKDWKEKKEVYLEKINHASKDALLIVAVDKIHNMQAYFNMLQNKGSRVAGRHFHGTPKGYLWYYGAIGKILNCFLDKQQIVKDYMKILHSYKN